MKSVDDLLGQWERLCNIRHNVTILKNRLLDFGMELSTFRFQIGSFSQWGENNCRPKLHHGPCQHARAQGPQGYAVPAGAHYDLVLVDAQHILLHHSSQSNDQ